MARRNNPPPKRNTPPPKHKTPPPKHKTPPPKKQWTNKPPKGGGRQTGEDLEGRPNPGSTDANTGFTPEERRARIQKLAAMRDALLAQKANGQLTKNQRDRLQKLRKNLRKTATYTSTTPGDPGEANPTIDPFMTAEDLIEEGEAASEYNSTISELDYALEKMRGDTAYEKNQSVEAERANRQAADEDMAARGLFRSSVRDGELYDISATAALRRADLDRTLDAQVMASQRGKSDALSAYQAFRQGMDQKMVENAAGAAEEAGPWAREPTAPVTAKQKLKIPKPPGTPGGGKAQKPPEWKAGPAKPARPGGGQHQPGSGNGGRPGGGSGNGGRPGGGSGNGGRPSGGGGRGGRR